MEGWKGSFAQTQLEKFGWNKGEGLGKNRDGNVKHISVSVKNDKKGVGVGQDQWEFAWWDHLYNKSASSVSVEKDEQKGEIKVSKKKKDSARRSKTGIISTSRPTGKRVDDETTESGSSAADSPQASGMAALAEERNLMDTVRDVHVNVAKKVASSMLYSGFVKSTSGALNPSLLSDSKPSSAATSPPKSDDDESDDDELKDYSIKISDAELFAACEGRTARKGGRGLVEQKGKYARVMQEYLRYSDDESESVTVGMKRKLQGDIKDTTSEPITTKKSKKEKKTKKDKKAEKEESVKPKKEKKAKKEKKDKKEKKSKVKESTEVTSKAAKKAKKDKKEKKEKKEKKNKN
ncbi:uncharacterized protein BYT42DRAFT_541672 [Radiomyces spectabilis]|uniref:uncharacterized protein n=1 Tax=Radiomyces spectabilis TaxID=64574 RepID=UPI002220F32F|nr:uncharacterized protein BYT42DRAFT_541672 [Radiomyces spectabilis]KAI8393396.1 hypothetical protein BYT42DRAFT_541672 [Radiomyces spectabilis]